MSRSRNWCFTLNNYSEEDEQKFQNLECKYLVFGYEVGEENKTPHLQGYVEFSNATRLDTLKKINERIHWESRKGSAQQAADYCKKSGYFFEKGQISKQGERTDLKKTIISLKDKKDIRYIVDEHPVEYIKFHRGIESMLYHLVDHRKEPPHVTWLWGKAGTGKTRYAVEAHDTFYIKDGTQWWNGYNQEKAIIIDDFDGHWPYRDLLRLLDRYPYQGQTKGGYVKINSPFIYITCEYAPNHFWQDNELAQILRRVTVVTEVTGNTDGDLRDDKKKINNYYEVTP